MKTKNEILEEVANVFKTSWKTRKGIKIPEAEDVKEANDAVKFDGTVLYADMRDSTNLVNGYKDWFAAEIYKSYLSAACHIIKNNGGEITAFDGDRVMAVFIGNSKNTSAAKAALQINFIVKEINTILKSKYTNNSFVLKQSVGIDTSTLFVAKTGIRSYNDLVWVGRAANYAAKLSTLGDENYSTFITESVYDNLNVSSKNGGNPARNMWEKTIWNETGIVIYKSTWWWAVE